MSHRPIDRLYHAALQECRGRDLTLHDRACHQQAVTADPLVARCVLVGLATIAALCIVQFA